MRLLIGVAALAWLVPGCGGCGDHDADTAPEPEVSSEREPETGGAVRLGQCGYVKPGAVRGGTQGMSVDTADFGPGVDIELDTLQIRPVVGNWACLLATVVDDDPPAPRDPADLGRFVLLREERRTVDAASATPAQQWLWVTSPAWVTEVERLHGEVLAARGDPSALERACEAAGRARPDPDAVRSEAVTAMRHFVATGQVREEVSVTGDRLVERVGEIAETCGW